MHVNANGILMNYELSGPVEAPLVMLSHSLGSSLAMWDPQITALESRYRVLRYDIRGHGGSEAPLGDYTLDQLGDDVIALLDALAIDAAHWVGLSLGGMIGQNLGLRHGDRLYSLALCDTMALVPVEAQPVWQERIARARAQGMQALVDETLARWFTEAFLRENPPGVKLIRQHILSTPVPGYIGCSEAIRRLNYLEQLGEVTLPTLVMVGADDPGTPVAVAEAIHARISGSRLVVIPDAAHLSNVEQPEVFNRALLAFLNGQ